MKKNKKNSDDDIELYKKYQLTDDEIFFLNDITQNNKPMDLGGGE